MIRACLEKRFFSKHASIVISGSARALYGDPHQLPLGIVSGSVVAMAKCISESQECISQQVRVNCVIAGHVSNSSSGRDDNNSPSSGGMMTGVKQAISGQSSSGHNNTQLTGFDIATQFLHLASPQTSSGVTGSCVTVCNGQHPNDNNDN